MIQHRVETVLAVLRFLAQLLAVLVRRGALVKPLVVDEPHPPALARTGTRVRPQNRRGWRRIAAQWRAARAPRWERLFFSL